MTRDRTAGTIRVFLDRPTWYFRKANTDFAYVRHELPQLCGVKVLFPSKAWSAAENGREIAAALAARVPGYRPRPHWDHRMAARAARRSGAELVYTNMSFPANSPLPVVWQNTLIDPEMRAANGEPAEFIAFEAASKLPLFERSALVLVSTAAEEQRIVGQFPTLKGTVRYSPFFRPQLPAAGDEVLRKHQAPEVVELLFVGNDARRKGLPRLVAALDGLPAAARRRLRFTVISGFRDGQVAMPADVPTRVLSDVPRAVTLRHFLSAHILANPAIFETYGFVFTEAMAHGVAALGPCWEVQRELLDDGAAGVLVAPDDDLRGPLLRLVEDDEHRAKVAAAGLDRFRAEYAPDRVAERLHGLLAEVIRR